MVAFQACVRVSVPVVTAYSTLGLDALAYSLELTRTRVIITDEALLPSLVEIIDGRDIEAEGGRRRVSCVCVRVVVYVPRMDGSEPSAAAIAALTSRPQAKGGPISVISFGAMLALGRRAPLDSAVLRSPTLTPTPDSTACIMFTSGTTGLPKGVEMTHANMVASVGGLGASVPALKPSDVYLGYLPLAHVLELVAETALLAYGCSIGYASPRTITDASSGIPRPAPGRPLVRGDAPVLRPTIMAGVPAVYDRVRRGVEAQVRKQSPLKQWLFWRAFHARNAARKAGLDTPLWNWLVFDPIRTRALGGRLRMMLSGGGPLAADTEEFISTVLCAPIAQGYGLTETCAAGCINWADDRIAGRVGPPVMCADVQLVDWVDAGYMHSDQPHARGELWITGPCITKGYYRSPEKTAEVFKRDAAGRMWFATGDIAELHDDGVFRIVDRRKDLFKLSHGEYIVPSKIETALLTSSLIENVMVHADSTRDFCIAIVVPNIAALRDRFPTAAQGGLVAIAADPACSAAILQEMQATARKQRLSRVETPHKVVLSTSPWTPENGMTTESMKVKRHAVAKAHAAAIQQAYAAA